jgi:hypothetical protein
MKSRDHLLHFVTAIDFPTVRKEWIDLFDREYANAGEIKPLIDEVVCDDDAVYAGMSNAATLSIKFGSKATDPITDTVIFILYLWYRKNVLNDPTIASEFPTEL